MTELEMIAQLTAQNIATAGLDSAGILAAYNRAVEEQVENFRNSRKPQVASKITQGAFRLGLKDPTLAPLQDLVCEVISCEHHSTNARGVETYKFSLGKKGYSRCTAYGDRFIAVDQMVMIEARVLQGGEYQDADASGALRSMIVPSDRKMIYSPTYGVKLATVNRVQVMHAIKFTEVNVVDVP